MQRGVIFGFGAGASIIVAIFLFDLFGVKNGWCGHLCPLGATYSIIGKKSLIRVSHNHENCTKPVFGIVRIVSPWKIQVIQYGKKEEE